MDESDENRLQRPNRTRPLTNDELKRLAKKYPPSQEWFESDGVDFNRQLATDTRLVTGLVVCVAIAAVALVAFGWMQG